MFVASHFLILTSKRSVGVPCCYRHIFLIMEISWGHMLVTSRFFNHGGQLEPRVGNHMKTIISHLSLAKRLRTPQNVPAWLYPCSTILLGLVAKFFSIASTALVRSYFSDKLLTRCNHLQKYLDKDHVRISWQEKLWHTHGKDLAELSNTREEQGGLG